MSLSNNLIKLQEYTDERVDYTKMKELTCHENTDNLVCNKNEDNGSESVGVCLGNTFARNPACDSRAQEICGPKGGFKPNVCSISSTTYSLNNKFKE